MDFKTLCTELAECLSEAVILMEDIRSGDYVPDSLTVQPWVAAIKAWNTRTIAQGEK